MSNRIILIDDDRDYLEVLGGKLQALGYHRLTLMDDPAAAAAEFEAGAAYDLALIDMTMPEMDGVAMLEHIKNTSPGTECIMVTAINEARTAVECLKKGAYDYLVKPVAKDVLALTLPRALERKRLLDILDMAKRRDHPALINPEPFRPIVTRSPNIQRLLKEAELHAGSNVPILITGESGTGKELLARAIHGASARADFPFTAINMASISTHLFESEFFGHTRGAFTGAQKERAGFLERTHGGSLFLDEIGDLPLELQGKLLRVLQDGEYARVGSSTPRKVDLRFIAATNENLDQMMARRAFRKDLYYRIRGGWLHLPPLRERRDDIVLLADTFARKYQPRPEGQTILPAALEMLTAYNYPGNVRELKTIIQTAVNLAQGQPIDSHHLPAHLPKNAQQKAIKKPDEPSGDMHTLAEAEKRHILKIYRQLSRNKSQTAKILGIGLNTLRRKLTRYGVA